ncbi:hypothetical protein WA158_004938 [Blastocystis sp. Blastoise]
MAQVPINFTEVANLSSLGIAPANINFKNVTMVSDKYICIREEGATPSLAIVDTDKNFQVTRQPMGAEAAIMNPVSKVIALRKGNQLQVYNLDMKSKMASFKLPDSASVTYWTWIDTKTIAIVTQAGVFHWSIEGEATPKKIFDRLPDLASSQIINYRVSANGKWCLLIGIKKGANNSIAGDIQLYSIEHKKSQHLFGHAAGFCTIEPAKGKPSVEVFVFIEKKDAMPQGRFFCMEVGNPQGFKIVPKEFKFAPDAPTDFPVSLELDQAKAIAYVVTKFGYVYMFDVFTGSLLFRSRLSTDTIFVTVNTQDGGVFGITTQKGQVLKVSMNEDNLIPFVLNTLKQQQLALELATRLGLPGADDIFRAQFENAMQRGDFKSAAKIAYSSPPGVLRTESTLRRLQSMSAMPGQQAPFLQYVSTLLECGQLNEIETIELCRPVFQQGKKNIIENWLKDNKLTCSEALGDIFFQQDAKLALGVYYKAKAHDKVIACLVRQGLFDKVLQYAKTNNYTPDYNDLIRRLIQSDPQGAENFTKMLASTDASLIDAESIADAFLTMGFTQQATGILLEIIQKRGDLPEDGHIQTRVLEINLSQGHTQVAEAILSSNIMTHFDKAKIASLCERSGLVQQALELYSDLDDIKRVIVNTQMLKPEWLVTYLGSMAPENCMECLRALVSSNLRNIQIVVKVGQTYAETLGSDNIVALLEEYNSTEGLFYFLGSIVNTTKDPKVQFKYIQAATKLGQYKEVERICREGEAFDPQEVKQFLIEARLPEPLPLIHVCNRFDMLDEMTQYLYENKLPKYIDAFVTKVAPQKTPVIIGKLIDLDASDEYIIGLLNAVSAQCPIAQLVEVVEGRNRLRMLQGWLEARLSEGNQTPELHNAIGKIYITINKEPQEFLLKDQFYEPAVLGKFCEKLDPYLAYLAYRRANGGCDDDLIRVTNENGLFKDQARYLVERQDEALWTKVLNEENEFKDQLVEQVVNTALPESKNPDEVSKTVKAFIDADLPEHLIGLLERLVLQGSDFANNKNLQNLLIITGVRAARDKVMEYINRLDNFDGPKLALFCLDEEYKCYEEAFTIYKKFQMPVEAVCVLLNQIQSIDRAYEFAERCANPQVWSKVAKAQLDDGQVDAAIASYIRAQDPSNYLDVIFAAERDGCYESLIDYLHLVRKTMKQARVDTSLVYALAKTDKMAELEEFIISPNVAQIQNVGDRCYDEGMYEAAKRLFDNIGNNAKLAACYIALGKYREAVDAAKKANAVKTWKEVNEACLKAQEYKLAATAALSIIVSPDHLESLVNTYESRGLYDEIIKIMEQGLGLENAHTGIFTELACLYSKHRQEKVMEHLKIFWNRMHVPKVLRACENARLWNEAVYLYVQTEEYDMGVRTMMDHAADCFNESEFYDIIQKVRNQELFYKAIDYFLLEQPLLLEKYLAMSKANLDHSRVVLQVQKAKHLPLIQQYLKSVQSENIAVVNEAINDLCIEDEDYEALRESVDSHDNFDQIALASKLESNDLLEFRRIAAYLYKRNEKYEKSVEISKKDEMFADAIETACVSRKDEIATDLLTYFVEKGDKECFSATLFTCYDLIEADVALELAYRYNFISFAIPYFVQYIKETNNKIAELEKLVKPEDNGFVQPAVAPFGGVMQIADAAAPMAPMAPMGAPMGAPAPMAPMGGMPPMGMAPMGAPMGAPAPMAPMGNMAPMGGMPPMGMAPMGMAPMAPMGGMAPMGAPATQMGGMW